MSRMLLRLLARFLVLPASEADPGPAPADTDPAPAAEDTLDDLIDAAGAETDVPRETEGDEPAAPAPRISANEQRLQRELEDERVARRVAEQRQAPAATPRHDAEWEREERELADYRARGASENDIGWAKFRIDTNRANRETRAEAAATLRRAEDLSDQSAFRSLKAEKPALFNRYADRVEAEVNKMRAAGQAVPPREAILKYLAGNDLVNGNLKKTTTAPKPATPAAPTQTVDRGRMPQARTDVRGRANAASERDKRRERLRDVPL